MDRAPERAAQWAAIAGGCSGHGRCNFESICESCSFFVTTIEFKPTLLRQRDDALAKGQVGRQKIFDGLLDRLDEDAS